MPIIQVATFEPYGVIILGCDDQGYHVAVAIGKDGLGKKQNLPSEKEAHNKFLYLVRHHGASLEGKLEEIS